MARTDPALWDQISKLFAGATQLPAPEQSDFLSAHCGGNEALRREVELLLEAHGEAGNDEFLKGLDKRFLGLAEAALTEQEESAPAEQIGAWRIREELGRGGMGVVYLAERVAGEFEQVAAVKVIKRGMETDQILERFLRERQILARMSHPGIARLLDGGVTATGQPWFALEYVDGVPLTNYCDSQRLNLNARLELFLKVCSAVEYAHRNFVVHRDIKPSNILVDASGAVKLLDFGIAKLVDGELGGNECRTEAGFRIVTPDYGAPEQVLDGAVTTATDVYSLGVVLCELLSGERPHRYESGDLATQIEQLVAMSPTRLSRQLPQDAAAIAKARRTTPTALRRRLAGDLETIAAKAIQGAPERRYGSAEALREDVERYLAGLPIRARTDSALYRAKMFLRRHRGAVAAATLVFASLIAGLAAALWQAGVAARERDAARRAAKQSRRNR